MRSPTPRSFSKVLKRSRRIVIFVGRILVGIDWESRLPCVLGPRKSRLPLFTRKQQRLLDKAIEMDGVPDLSALLKGKLQLLTKKSTTVDPQGPSDSGVDVTSEGGGASREEASREGASREEGPIATDQGGTAETSASGPKKKKKKTKRTKVRATDEVPPEESAPVNATLTDEVHPEESAPVDATSEGSMYKKKKDGRKKSQPRPSTSDANVADAAIVDAVGEASEAGHVSIEDPVLVSDSSSEGREGEEVEDDRVEETSSLQPVEEEKTDEVGNRDVPPPPAVDSLVSIPTRVEDPTVTEDPVGPSALGTPEEIGQDYAP
ncbi:hypothetical protein HID58_041496 [Brassica napus]|uniref:Uncharacterized protein n=1 Tax=Brassica napus TaxID=3708 RepID=A0ABQ8BBA1_BRANA|nr:hypothetical protein HID58_041496 [Brassica napus]